MRDGLQHLPGVPGACSLEAILNVSELVEAFLRLCFTHDAQLSALSVTTRVMLTGTLVVARDLAHAKIRARLEAGEPMPAYFKDHPVYYAGPAKTPDGYASGAFGPTTAGRMDAFVDQFQALGGSMVMLAKGNRGRAVREACKKHGGFYLGSIGGAAAGEGWGQVGGQWESLEAQSFTPTRPKPLSRTAGAQN